MNYNCGDNITIFNNGSIYIVNKEPYETVGDCYKRGWYIINNIKLAISLSFLNKYTKHIM